MGLSRRGATWREKLIMCIHSVARCPYTNMIIRTVNENNKGRNDATHKKKKKLWVYLKVPVS